MLVAVLCGAALHLAQSHPDNRHVTLGLEFSLVLLGVFWIRALERRLYDAGLPRWSFWPYFLFVFTVCFGAHEHRMIDGPRTLALFIALQIPVFLLQSQPAHGEFLPRGAAPLAARSYPGYLTPVGPFLFLLRILLIAAFSAELIHLAQKAGPGVARWELALTLVILPFVWIYNVEARILDAQLPSWASAIYCLIVPIVCCLPILVHRLSSKSALVMFVVLQIPAAFLQSKARLAPPSSPEIKPARQTEPLGAFDFAVYILLIAGLWHVLHLLRGDVMGGGRAWPFYAALDAGSLSLCLAWVVSVKKRLADLDLTRWYVDCCSMVFILSLLPFAFRMLTLPHALILFAVLQIPVVFMRREFIPASFLPVDTDS